MTENIQHLRLINGEEIIGDILNVTESSVVIDNPLIVDEQSDQYGNHALVLTKYIPFAKNKVCEILREHVITMTELHSEMVKYYYLSLKLNVKKEVNMINEIARVNYTMEQMMFDRVGEDGYIHPTTDTKH